MFRKKEESGFPSWKIRSLSEEAYRASQRIWQEKGMPTFKDRLRFYNNLQLKWYLYRGLKITTVHWTIDYVPQKREEWFSKLKNKISLRGSVQG